MATIRKRPNGRWQAIIRRKNLHASKAFDRQIDAKTWARKIEHDADMGRTGLPGRAKGTLAGLIDRYEKEMWPVKHWGASKAHELKMLHRDLGNRLLSELTRSVVLAYVRGLKLAPGGVSGRLSYLREVIKTGRDLWNIQAPLDEIDAAITTARQAKLSGSTIARHRRPTERELEAIVAYAGQQTTAMIDLAAVVRVLSVLPLRVGELLGIEWDDLNETRRTAIIRSRKHPDFRVRETSVDEVPLIAFRGVDTFALVSDRPRYLPSPFPYKRGSVSTAFGMAALRCQIKDLHIHDLRAHAISTLLEAGVAIPQVALISGHKNWKVLAKHYSRIDPATVHDSIGRLT